jgi:hypothetical protein
MRASDEYTARTHYVQIRWPMMTTIAEILGQPCKTARPRHFRS